MKYVVKHGLDDQSRVRMVIEKAFESYRERLKDHDPQLQWLSDTQAKVTFSVMKKTIAATFTIAGDEVRVDGDMPFLFRPFEGKVKSVISQEVEKWIAKAKAGEI